MHYTILDTATLNHITKTYPIGDLESFKLLQGGLENTNYLITTTTGDFVLTICEQKSKAEALYLVELLGHLNVNGLSTTQIIKNKEGIWGTSYKGKPILLKTYLQGKVIPVLSNQQVEALGKQLATLHSIPTLPIIPTQLGYGIEHFKKVKAVAPTAPFCSWLFQTKAYIESFFSESLPKALIHSDLFYNNIIIDSPSNTLTIIDFEEAAYYYRIYDIGMTLVGVCSFDSQLDLEKARHLLQGYQQLHPLTKAEQIGLQAFTVYAAAATAFWRYMNFNFVRPSEAQKDHYLEMQYLASHIQAIPSLQFRTIF